MIKLARRKKRLYGKSRKSLDNFKIWEKYKKIRNKLKSLIKREYHSYVTDIANDISDHGKKLWSFVRASKAKPTASSFNINDISVTDPTVIRNSFNDFFYQIFPFLMKPDIVDTWCEGHQGTPYLTGVQTNSYEVLKIIKTLRNGKAPGPDGITSTMLKHTAAQVAFPLALIFNLP